MVEGLLFAFHLKGSGLDWKLHFLLVLVVLLAGFCCFAEMQHPQSLLLSVVRAQLVLLQGIWFCQIAQILFRGVAPLLTWILAIGLTELCQSMRSPLAHSELDRSCHRCKVGKSKSGLMYTLMLLQITWRGTRIIMGV